jgi:hypothetical protein
MSPPRFAAGTPVRVRDLPIETHMRVPTYARNKRGVIERYCGPYLNPEDLAFGRATGPAAHLYQVEFSQKDLWENYPNRDDKLFLEIYEHWLEPA